MEVCHPFQGVACHSFDRDKPLEETIIIKLLGVQPNPVTHHDVTCYELKLSNKYYETTIHLFNHEASNNTDILDMCQAVILHGDGEKLTVEQLDRKVEQFQNVSGEPRVLLYHNIDDDCNSFKTLSEWSIKNNYDFIDANQDDARELLIDSLSAYKWRHRMNAKPSMRHFSREGGSRPGEDEDSWGDLDDDTMKKLKEFDNLLGKLSAYRDRPELRGNPGDKNIEEIAQILSGLLTGECRESDDDENYEEDESSNGEGDNIDQLAKGDQIDPKSNIIHNSGSKGNGDCE